MTPKGLTVRCMAWQESGVWVAACIDLTLAVQGNSERDVRNKLHTQIRLYINEAVKIDAAHAEELLTRRAPMRDQLRYAFWSAVERRPRIRRSVYAAVRRITPAIRRTLAYIEPLSVKVS